MRWIRPAAVVAGGVVVAGLLWWLRGILLPFVLAVAITYVLNPVVTALQSRLKQTDSARTTAVASVYVVIAVVLVVVGRFVVPGMLRQLVVLGEAAPELIGELEGLVAAINKRLQIILGREVAAGAVSDLLAVLEETLSGFAREAVLSVPVVLTGLLSIGLSPFLAFYMLRDIDVLKKRIRMALPDRYRDEIVRFLGAVDRALANYVRSQLLVAAVIGGTATLGLLLLDVRFALILGVFAGVMEVIPYFGPFLGATPAVLMAMLESPALAAKVVVLFFAIQQFDAVYLSPKIIGGGVGLHPLVVIFVLLVGGRALGIVGLLLAVPVTVVGRVVVNQFPWRLMRDDHR